MERPDTTRTRRDFMISSRTVLGGVGVTLIGGLVWRAYDRAIFTGAEGDAYEIWNDWQNGKNAGLLRLCEAGVLAPSPKNSQPWVFQISKDKILVLADLDRSVGKLDPTRHQLFMAIGCAIENMILAARAQGYTPRISLSLGPDSGINEKSGLILVAEISFASGKAERSQLYQAVATRHTNRSVHDLGRGIPGNIIGELMRVGNTPASRLFLFRGRKHKNRLLREMTLEATRVLASDRDIISENWKWMRWSREEVTKFRDGIDLNSLGITMIELPLTKMLPRPSAEEFNETWMASTSDRINQSNYMGVFAIPESEHNARSAISTGRVWQRLNLLATTHGLAIHPVNQLVTVLEGGSLWKAPYFSEQMQRRIMEAPGWVPAIVFRLGYPTLSGMRAPRRPLVTAVLT